MVLHSVALAAILLQLAGRPAIPVSRTPLAPGTFAISGVNLVTMASDRIIPEATIVIRNGRIAEIGPAAEIRLPAGTRVVDGRGKYLIPGLADMHAHLFSDADAPDSVAPYELGAMMANGITTTRLMMGTPEQLELRRAVMAGRIPGPQLWLASPEFAGRPYGEFHGEAVPTPETARAAVKRAVDAGYDFIKITLFVGTEPYDALVAEARRLGIPVVGHVDSSVGVPRALAAGQHIEHLDNYLEQVLADSAPSRVSVSDRGVYRAANWASLDHVDDAKILRIAGLTARSGTYVTPTLTIFRNAYGLGVADQKVREWPDWRMYPPAVRDLWLRVRERYWANPPAESRRLRWVAVRDRLVRAMADSGGRIMAGSDAPEWFHSYGWTLHRELESLVEAGLTPYQALASATRTPAEFLGAIAEWGTLEKGRRADLVLLSANPLADIRNTQKIEAVVVGGRWIDQPARQQMIRDAMLRLGGS